MSAPLLVFDGDCAFCSRCAAWLAARGACRVESWQRLALAGDLGDLGLTEEQVRTAAWWVSDGAHPLGGARAVAAALRSCAGTPLAGAYRALGVLVDARPVRPLAAAVYAIVARYRHRMPGGSPACRL
ncbi:DCC1-like thiol-disulfide oxidoreductase family protein [Nocardioides sp. GY 10127]|uniref:thiol-disulfide oxidoreductase DCC family protein n=1 Tax=Nocardioides sp. GY 10127 TaxID=2569762 RepID=UPI0010A76202|nr:DCC1-like thiol-disulfide oxidoreductase family protein [Nocardioides sp. GY 10127]TIC82736.1 DUF393 domain-containing protein [Nocardioides sp. GY 10127]